MPFTSPRLVTLKVLHFPLVLFRCLSGRKRTKIAPLPSLRIPFSRVQPVLAGFQFANHSFLSTDLPGT
jgi:hypothetical protein